MKQNRVLIVTALLALAYGTAVAEPSAKTGAGVLTSDVNVLQSGSEVEAVAFAGMLKTAQNSDLVVEVSLQCGLTTLTQVKSKGGSLDKAEAEAAVAVAVYLNPVFDGDGNVIGGTEALPGEVTFCSRKQTLAAELGGVFEDCTDLNGDGDIGLNECTLSDEMIELTLETMSANHFNFILPDVSSSGEPGHTYAVVTRLSDDATAGAGTANAAATIQKGSVVIQEVRLVKEAF